MKLEKHSLIDKRKILFHQSLITNNPRTTPLLSIAIDPSVNIPIISSLPQNWASQKVTQNVRFNDKQKQLLQEKFEEGIRTGSK